MRILIVEDDAEIAEVIALAFEMRWPEANISRSSTGKDAVDLVESGKPDLVVLDLGLPEMNGFDILNDIRLFSSVPVIILTARDDEKDIVKGLERGADDYIVKPFRQLVLMARAQAVVRRYNSVSQVPTDTYGDFRFGDSMHHLYIGNEHVNLTSTEGIIMSHFIRNAEKIIPVSTLANVVWGNDSFGSSEAVRVYIRRLRKKIEVNPESPEYIHTHQGLGYSLAKRTETAK